VLTSFIGPEDKPYYQIATQDVGALAAELLLGNDGAYGGWTGRRVFEVGRLLSVSDAALAASAVLGKPIKPRSMPRAAWEATMAQWGFPPSLAQDMAQAFESINNGWIHMGVPGTESVPGKVMLEEVFRAKWAGAGRA